MCTYSCWNCGKVWHPPDLRRGEGSACCCPDCRVPIVDEEAIEDMALAGHPKAVEHVVTELRSRRQRGPYDFRAAIREAIELHDLGAPFMLWADGNQALYFEYLNDVYERRGRERPDAWAEPGVIRAKAQAVRAFCAAVGRPIRVEREPIPGLPLCVIERAPNI